MNYEDLQKTFYTLGEGSWPEKQRAAVALATHFTEIESGEHADAPPKRNPKDIAGSAKPRWFSVMPLRVLIGVGKTMFEGGWKYGLHNYRAMSIAASVHVDACVVGHLMPWQEGQDYDENGMHHIDKAIASLIVLRDCILSGNWIDDRPIKAVGFDEQMERETEHFGLMKSELQKEHGDPIAPFTAKPAP